MSCDCNPCCPQQNNAPTTSQGSCTVCGPFSFSAQETSSEVWSTSDGSFVPGTVIVKLTGGDNNAKVQGTVLTPGGPVTFPTPAISQGNSYAKTFPAISKLTINKTAGNNATGEFCVCVGQLATLS